MADGRNMIQYLYMTYKTHLSVGFLFSSLVFLLIFDLRLSPVLALILIFSTFLGSSSPDLDTPSGGLWQKIPAGRVLSRAASPMFVGGHRHLSHSIIGLILFSTLYYLLLKFLGTVFNAQISSFISINFFLALLAYVIGFCSHLFADMFTQMGVPIFFPWNYHLGIPPDPFGRIRIKTGKWFENLIIYPAVNLALVLVIYAWLKVKGIF